jgi:outer membrane receptor protein involved in Fe transport
MSQVLRSSRACLLALLGAVIVMTGGTLAGTTGKIAGKIVDGKSREPIPGVNVVVVGMSIGASSDARGEFVIANVPAGVVTVRASQVGYRNVLVTDVRVKVDATAPVSIAMEEAVVDIGSEMVITAERPPVQKDNTASRVFIDNADITSRPTSSMSDVITSLPGINIENGAMKVRGGSMSEVAIIVDGARARNPLDQTPYFNFNLSSVQEMEVLTGTFNAEYGEARSAVFNIVTKEGGEKFSLYADLRYTPAGVKHWGSSIYDYSSTDYWENSHARHPEWWVQYPDQWVDPSGFFGSDPRCTWTPEQAYAHYMATHQPLHDYTNMAGYSGEVTLTGPVPGVEGLGFALSGKYATVAPLYGNSYRDKGVFFDGNAKITYRLSPATKLMFTAFLGTEQGGWGIGGYTDAYYFRNYGLTGRYAFYDYAGYPESRTDGETIKLDHVLSQNSMLEVKLSRVFAHRKVWTFPDDPNGWSQLSEPTRDYLRAGVTGGDGNYIGLHTLGYQYRYDNKNTNWMLSSFYQNQITKYAEVKAGVEFEYNILKQNNQALYPPRTDDHTYEPYQGAAFAQTKLEFSGFIMNFGLRYDYYNPNDAVYLDLFDPLNGPTESTHMFSQLSPRLGISHPIDENTVLHFSYGQFFQRSSFGDYGEGTGGTAGSLTTYVVDGTSTVWNLGNRQLKPEKTIAYEVGIERNLWDVFLLNVTGYYKDIRNTISTLIVETASGGTYRTNVNSDYADVKGFEFSLQKQAHRSSWGTTWGYVNFTTQIGIAGRSGDPVSVSPTGAKYAGSGDYIVHNNPRFKAGVYYMTPEEWDFLGGALSGLSLSLDYQAVFANELLPGDYFIFNNAHYVRPADQNTNIKLRKDFALFSRAVKVGFYVEIQNLFNNMWVYFPTFESCTDEEKQKFVDSGFQYLPSVDQSGLPILELAKYRNLPRSIVFGLTVEL